MIKRIALLLCLATLPLSAATFTVTSANDSGAGTLRQAILDANALAGPHTIAFNIAPGGPQTITPLTPLPKLTAAQTLLDATTQPGYTGVPIIELSGASAGNDAHGLHIDGATSRVQGFVVNGFEHGAGVYVTAPAVEVMNNYLGLDADGTTVLPNSYGVFCNDGCGAIRIGSPAGNDRNVISGNRTSGITINSAGPDNVIRANYIGTDATGMHARGNAGGIHWLSATGRIGDVTADSGNVISGNASAGVSVVGFSNLGTTLSFNRIGVAADGTTSLGNAFAGVWILSSGISVTRNTIAHNRAHGVLVEGVPHERNSIRANSIFANNLHGISLGGMSPVPNDADDVDAGFANNLQNYPVLTSAIWNAGMLTITGTLDSTPGTPFDIDFHSNTACDPSGFGEGEVFRHTMQVTTDANGDAAINATFAYPGTGFFTATATNRTRRETSEFSQCRVVTNALASSVQFENATSKVNEGAGFATLLVTRSGSTAGPATVEVLTSHGSASIPGDYLPPASSLLVWNDGDGAPKSVNIPIIEDDFVELPEQFSVELRNATGATLGAVNFATVTIEDRVSTVAMPTDLSIWISTRSTVAAQGDAILYEIVTINHGPNNASGVTITNVLPPQLRFVDIRAPLGWTCTTPAAGANGTITCTSAVLPAANGTSAQFLLSTTVAFDASGTIVNSATVSHAGSDPNPANSSASSEATTVQGVSADLSIRKTTTTAKVAAGAAFTYTITVTNSGPGIASNVTMTDVLPPQLEFVSRSVITADGVDFFCGAPPVYTNGTLTCNASRMASGATATVILHVRAAANAESGTVTNTATVTSSTSDPDSADLTAAAPGVELVPGADLSIRKHTTTTSVRANASFTYTISLQNSGPSAATNVVVTDKLPAGLLFEGITPPAGFTCTAPGLGANITVTCTGPSLPASRVGGFNLRVRVAPNARAGAVTNVASVTSATFDPDADDTTAAAPPVMVEPSAGAERRLDASTATRLPQTAPQVATTEQNALAVWREGNVPLPAGATASIRGALFRPDAAGETLLDFAAPAPGTDVAYPNVAAAADRYLVVWRESTSSQGRVLARRIRVDGSFIDAEPLVLETGNAVVCCTDAGDPRPVVASDGRDFYVAWVSSARDVRGIVVPSEGPVVGQPTMLSGDTPRGRYDLEIVRTPAMYIVLWLDRVEQQPSVLRLARVTPGGVRIDTQTIAGLEISSITATAHAEGALVTADYEEAGPNTATRTRCVGVLLLSPVGEPLDTISLRCTNEPAAVAPVLHSKLVPVANGFLLVQPGRRYTPSFRDTQIRTSTLDAGLTSLSEPTFLGAVGQEVAVTTWKGAPLLVYNHADRDATGTSVPRVFAFFLQQQRSGRMRAVRH